MANDKKTQTVVTEKASTDKPVDSESVRVARETARALVEELLPAMVASQRATQGPTVAAKPPRSTQVCSECGQLEAACGKKHEQMVVYPTKYPEFAEWFQGVAINGHRYISNNAEHKITVPLVAAADIRRIVYDFEINERETRIGKTKTRNSGDMNSARPVGGMASPSDGWR